MFSPPSSMVEWSFLLMPYNTFLLECEIPSNSSALMMLPSTSANLSPPDTNTFVSFNIFYVKIHSLPSPPTSKTLLLAGIVIFFLVVTIPPTPLGLTTISSPPTAFIHPRLKNTQSTYCQKTCTTPLFSCGSQMTVFFDGFAKIDNSFRYHNRRI